MGIRSGEGPCPVCDAPPLDMTPVSIVRGGQTILIPATFAGAEGRYEDYVYLQMLQREWERPEAEFDTFPNFKDDERPSARAALVLLFWSYFETRIERLHRSAMRALPQPVLDDALKRYSGIGVRIDRLYKIFYGTTYFADLAALGHAPVAELLEDLHNRRNEFTHGKPQAINDATVEALVRLLKSRT